MRNIFTKLKVPSFKKYDLFRLLDAKSRQPVASGTGLLHLICDIDKTYLETEFESFYKMARIAFENAEEKITVRGASDVLLAARWGENTVDLLNEPGWPRPLHFISSSPPQLRGSLEEKLSLDGLDWHSDTFKNQLYNVIRGRMDLLRQHVAYKSAAILSIMKQAGADSKFVLIGDNAEWDAYIYLGIALFLQNNLSAEAYTKYLQISGIEPSVAESVVKAYVDIDRRGIEVRAILIREAPGYQFIGEEHLSTEIYCFENYWQAALQLIGEHVIPASLLPKLARTFHNHYGFQRRLVVNELAEFMKDRGNDANLAQIAQGTIETLTNYDRMQPTYDPTGQLRYTQRKFSSLKKYSSEEILNFASQWVKNIEFAKEAKKKKKAKPAKEPPTPTK